MRECTGRRVSWNPTLDRSGVESSRRRGREVTFQSTEPVGGTSFHSQVRSASKSRLRRREGFSGHSSASPPRSPYPPLQASSPRPPPAGEPCPQTESTSVLNSPSGHVSLPAPKGCFYSKTCEPTWLRSQSGRAAKRGSVWFSWLRACAPSTGAAPLHGPGAAPPPWSRPRFIRSLRLCIKPRGPPL